MAVVRNRRGRHDVRMDLFDRDRCSERDCVAVFRQLFPLGLVGDDVVTEIAPAGWRRSPLVVVFHPSVEQIYRESLRIHRNLSRLGGPRREEDELPAPTLDEIRESWRDEPIDDRREVADLVGRCLWDVFSDNHEVTGPDGRLVDLGSFRGSADFIADVLNDEMSARAHDYMDFYMGTALISERADLTPVYCMIFRRLRAHGFDWTYVFPRLHCVTFDSDDALPLAEHLERERERTQLDKVIEEGHREALEAAKDRRPPTVVEAHRHVYGDFPRGWPPWD